MDFITYQPLWWLLLLGVMVAAFCVSLVDRGRWLKLAAFGLRCLAVLLLVLALCRPFVARQVERSHIVFLVDVSQSVALDAVDRTADRIAKRVEALPGGDTWSMYAFGSRVVSTNPEDLKKRVAQWRKGLGDDTLRNDSRIADALLVVKYAFPAGRAKRVELYSDGRPTRGDLAAAKQNLTRENIDLRVAKLGGMELPEASVVSLTPSTPNAYQGERVRLTACVSSNVAMSGELRLLNRGVVAKSLPVKLTAGENRISLDVPMTTAGQSVWKAELRPVKDHFPLNNQASCTVTVKGKARVLALHQKPVELRAFARAMGRQNITVDVRGEKGLPDTIEGLCQFDAVIIADLPATAMTTRQMLNLKSYVKDFGGGLVMLGSENSFGLGGYYKTPVEEVLPIISRYEKEKEKASVGLVLVIDKSGSMGGVPIALARQAAKAAVELLGPKDRVGVVAFDGQPHVICEMTSAADSMGIATEIERIAAGGGTNMYPGMAKAHEMLSEVATKVKHVIVLADGQSQGGDFIGLAEEMSNSGMTVSTVALGNGADANLMKRIADAGGGRFYHTLNPDNVPRIFTKETMEASRSAIREEPFVPVRVGASDIVEGIDFDDVPFLLGYVMTRARPTAQMILLTESGEPLLASKRFGLGKSLAFTSDCSRKWAGEWLEWRGFGRFWSQALRACIRKNDISGVTIRPVASQPGRYVIDHKTTAGLPVSDANWAAEVVDGNGRRRKVAVRPIGNGLYQADADFADVGRYSIRFHDAGSGKMKILHHNVDYPREYRLERQADKEFDKCGKLTASPGEGLAAVRARQDISAWLLVSAVLCTIGGVLLRRL